MKKIQFIPDQNHPAIKAYVDAMKKGLKSLHIIQKGDFWIVRRGSESKATKKFPTQLEAKEFAFKTAQKEGSSFFIYGEDGRISERMYF